MKTLMIISLLLSMSAFAGQGGSSGKSYGGMYRAEAVELKNSEQPGKGGGNGKFDGKGGGNGKFDGKGGGNGKNSEVKQIAGEVQALEDNQVSELYADNNEIVLNKLKSKGIENSTRSEVPKMKLSITNLRKAIESTGTGI
jgi:hypothetical protein